MTTIDVIIIHSSATRTGQNLRVEDIDRMYSARGFNQINYKFVSMIENGQSLSANWIHSSTKGFSGVLYNKHSVGICYVGRVEYQW